MQEKMKTIIYLMFKKEVGFLLQNNSFEKNV